MNETATTVESRATDESTHRLSSRTSLALIVVVVCAVVGLATGGPDHLPARIALDDGPWRLWVRLGGLAIALAGIAALRGVEPRGAGGSANAGRGGHQRGSLGTTLRSTATIMTVLAVVAILTRPTPPENRSDGPTPTASFGWIELGPTGSGAESAFPSSRSRGGSSRFRTSEPRGVVGSRGSAESRPEGSTGSGLLRTVGGYLGPLLFLVLVVALIVRIFARRPTPREPEPPKPHPLPPTAAAAGIERSLEDILWERGDPRDRIGAAYHRLLDALAASGADRRPEEAPHEHLYRALGPLGVRPEPLHQLAGLYVLARYGRRPVTERHRSQAVEALKKSLSALRTDPTGPDRGASA